MTHPVSGSREMFTCIQQVSDGSKSSIESAEAYAATGYDFIAFSDHAGPGYEIDKICTQQKLVLDKEMPLLILGGLELHGQDNSSASMHVLCLGDVGVPPIENGLVASMEYCRARDCLLILAHPHIMGHSEQDVLRHNFDGVEVYNHLALPSSVSDLGNRSEKLSE